MSAAACTYTLSSVPTFGEPVTLLVGLEETTQGALKVYLGHRAKGLYLLVTDAEEQETFRRAWATRQHVWMWPLPPADEIRSDAAEATGE